MAQFIPQRSGRTLIPYNPEGRMRPKSAIAVFSTLGKSPYTKTPIPALRIRHQPRPFLGPLPQQKKEPEDSMYSSTKDTESSLRDLQIQVKTLEDQLKKVTQERDKLAQVQKVKALSLGKVYRAHRFSGDIGNDGKGEILVLE